MSRVRYRAPGRTNSWLSRRRVLALAATGVGVSAVSVAGLSLAGESSAESNDDGAPLVISLRDVKKGTIEVFSGEKSTVVTDKDLVNRLLKAAGR
ncbi:hypothetical protein [Actinoplanes sp. G11-F43]|uniref:hypothetical protein n=1 Tax=Actinoplanes sp. G11-F43 TaxID=3424130 RepID=UPI003D32ACBE